VRPAATPIIAADADPEPTADAVPPEPTPGVPWDPPLPGDRPAQAPDPPAPRATASLVSARRPARPGFATVRAGEDLAAVARRVYGAAAAAEALWRANRDQLADPGSPLKPGMPLRTP
jgi:nucleoid-associated protein YgaU